ncbi:MAG: BrnT family toxin [Terracidiphilus sp.]|jgi:uncharacterized DUF497 family protein
MEYVRFDWDEGNLRKNEKHGVTKAEVEQAFLNRPLIVATDVKHSRQEPRFHALGRTDANRCLFVTFTERGDGTLIRPISARAASRKERRVYEEALKANP